MLRFMNYLGKKFLPMSSSISGVGYQSLTPTDDADPDGEYCRALRFAVEHSNIKNIAVTGGYGSGKSSVLNTFERVCGQEYNFLNISLATFKEPEFSKSKKDKIKNDENRVAVERSILQQLFYSVDQSDIPRSRFKRISNPTKRFVRSSVLFFLVFILFALYQLEPERFSFLGYDMPTWFSYFNLAMLFIFSYVSLIGLYRFALQIQEMKFKFNNAEINIKEGAGKSIINDHLDEILYFFECTEFNVIVIEDLDRFNDPEIFIRLRELNALINKSGKICRKVIFVYAIKDNMFQDRDRSKFFDFIVPIIPVINPTNSYDKIKEKYDTEGVGNRFLSKVCLYFDDLRLVYNIFNEYEVYLLKLSRLHPDRQKLLSIIIYKNYFPGDFSALHSNKGMVYKLFNEKKENLINQNVKDLKDSINEISDQISSCSREVLSSLEGLNRVYLYEILARAFGPDRINPSINVNLSGVNFLLSTKEIEVNVDEAVLVDNFDIIKSSGEINFIANFGNRKISIGKVSFQEIEGEIGEYEKRKRGILNKNISSELKEKRYNLQERVEEIKYMSLHELLSFSKNEEIFGEEPQILRFLVREGYIDETYSDYISLFYDSAITIRDKEFALSIANKKPLKFDLQLTKIDELLSRFLDKDSFRHDGVLNFSLVDYVLANSSAFSEHVRELFKTISRRSDSSERFVLEYLNKDKSNSYFINYLLEVWPDFFEFCQSEVSNSREIYKKWWPFINEKTLKTYEVKSSLRRVVESLDDPLFLFAKSFSDNNHIMNFLDILSPRFSFLECDDDNLGLFNEICSSKLFLVSKGMICQIIKVNTDAVSSDLTNILEYYPVSSILDYGPYFLKLDYESNKLEYIDKFVLEYDCIHEQQDVVVDLLNDDDIYLPLASVQALLNKSRNKIERVNDINRSEYWQLLFNECMVCATWSNIMLYYEVNECELNSIIFDFFNLEENFNDLSGSKVSSKEVGDRWDKDFVKKFESDLTRSQEVTDQAFDNLVGSLSFVWSKIDISELSVDRVQSMISNGKLSMSLDNLNSIFNFEGEFVLDSFVAKYPSEFLDLLKDKDSLDIGSKHFEELLGSKCLSEDNKKSIFYHCNLDWICDSQVIRSAIIEIFSNNEIDFNWFENIMSIVTESNFRVDLFLCQIKYFNNEEIRSGLIALGGDYQVLAESDGYSKISWDHSENNIELIDALYRYRFITKPDISKGIFNKFGRSIRVKRRLR
ncbi:hypothetical protein NLU14_21035 [Marinobacter sp. 71-i]|uniref:YobI-like P-loop NTPase domain-containing protein n=1 Tax=Marinobacter iranensis TaxID=2962607 RepID=A0ABT5YG86_9GAMM|nr:hypothetical protein [Marinobacter iranensis]MDF0752718.1 hypothetical protein [Marinobacter iranensis]